MKFMNITDYLKELREIPINNGVTLLDTVKFIQTVQTINRLMDKFAFNSFDTSDNPYKKIEDVHLDYLNFMRTALGYGYQGNTNSWRYFRYFRSLGEKAQEIQMGLLENLATVSQKDIKNLKYSKGFVIGPETSYQGQLEEMIEGFIDYLNEQKNDHDNKELYFKACRFPEDEDNFVTFDAEGSIKMQHFWFKDDKMFVKQLDFNNFTFSSYQTDYEVKKLIQDPNYKERYKDILQQKFPEAYL